ncbi:MAG: hypothetical protein ACRELX_18330 [Longimicrobiales bacterium]
MAHDTVNNDLPTLRLERFPPWARMAAPILIVIGLIALVGAFVVDADRAWRAYLVNWLFTVSVALGAVLLAVIVTITKGLWSRSTRRIALSFAAFLPVAYLLLIPIFFGASHIFPWIAEPVPGKEAYLNLPFTVVRNLVAMGALIAIALVFAYWSLRPDVGLLRNDTTGKLRGWYDRIASNWRGQEVEEAIAHKRIAVLAPIFSIVYAVALTVVAFDMVMSLEPTWLSTLIGPYFFMAGLLGGIAATIVLVVLYMRTLGLEELILPTHLHDLGKLTFAFVIFWAYLFFAQFIVIWYGLLPHEQAFVAHRFGSSYKAIAQLVFACLFVLPFFGLLGVAPKKQPEILATFAAIVLIGLWFERYLLVYPSLYVGVEDIPLGWQEIGIGLGFIGLLLGSVVYFATRFPLFQLWQPMSELELGGIEVAVAPERTSTT